MRVVNELEIMEIIDKKQYDLSIDGNREYSDTARMVADWGIDQLQQIKDLIKTKAFDVTFSQYKSARNGER